MRSAPTCVPQELLDTSRQIDVVIKPIPRQPPTPASRLRYSEAIDGRFTDMRNIDEHTVTLRDEDETHQVDVHVKAHSSGTLSGQGRAGRFKATYVLREIDIGVADDYVADPHDAGCGLETQRKALYLLQAVLGYAVRRRRISYNPMLSFDKPRGRRRAVKPLPLTAIETMIASLPPRDSVLTERTAARGGACARRHLHPRPHPAGRVEHIARRGEGHQDPPHPYRQLAPPRAPGPRRLPARHPSRPHGRLPAPVPSAGRQPLARRRLPQLAPPRLSARRGRGGHRHEHGQTAARRQQAAALQRTPAPTISATLSFRC
jgi:hypothetical protein